MQYRIAPPGEVPQGLGKNVYPTLSEQENLEFFSRLLGHAKAERRQHQAVTILYRSVGADVVWPQMLAIAAIGAVLFALSLRRFRATIAQMA